MGTLAKSYALRTRRALPELSIMGPAQDQTAHVAADPRQDTRPELPSLSISTHKKVACSHKKVACSHKKVACSHKKVACSALIQYKKVFKV